MPTYALNLFDLICSAFNLLCHSWFVMAENEKEAIEFVEKEIKRRKSLKFIDRDHISDYEYGGWGTDYYNLTVVGHGDVLVNDNS